MAVTWLLDPAPVSGERVNPMVRAGPFLNSPIGNLDQELDVGWGVRAGPGLRLGRVTLLIPLESGMTMSPHPERDTHSLSTFGMGVALEGTLLQKQNFGVHGGAGYVRRWLFGSGPVLRRCDEVGGCDGGYWMESPSYSMAGPFASLITSFTSHRDRIRFGIAVETRIERPAIELPGTGTVRGLAISTSLAVTLGRAQPR